MSKKVISVNVDTGETKVISLSTKLATNFSANEFMCKKPQEFLLYSAEMVKHAQRIRSKCGEPLTVTSAHRTISYNVSCGGATDSYHLHGRALDLYRPKGLTWNEFCKIVEEEMNDTGGLIYYPNKNFIHIDNRETPYRNITL